MSEAIIQPPDFASDTNLGIVLPSAPAPHPQTDILYRVIMPRRCRRGLKQHYYEMMPAILKTPPPKPSESFLKYNKNIQFRRPWIIKRNEMPQARATNESLIVFKLAIAAFAACAREVGFTPTALRGKGSDLSPVKEYVIQAVVGDVADMLKQHASHICKMLDHVQDQDVHTKISFSFIEIGGAQLKGTIARGRNIVTKDGNVDTSVPYVSLDNPSALPIYTRDIPIRIKPGAGDNQTRIKEILIDAYQSVLGLKQGNDIIDTVELNLGEPARLLRSSFLPLGLIMYRNI